MIRKWFQQKEIMAGTKRLMLSFYIYKIFGEFALRIISFFVTLGAFIISKDRRQYVYQYFETLEKYTNKKFPKFISSYKLFLNYGNALVDKIISFSGNLSYEKFCFIEGENEVLELIGQNKGMFFVTTHIGNIEILRSYLNKSSNKINIFLEKRSCKIFNEFLETLNISNKDITSYPVEDIEINTAIEISEKIEKGEMVFMAGDRLSMNNPDKTYSIDFLNRKIKLPLGAMKFIQVLNVPVFFIVCAKKGKKHNVHIQKFSPKSKNKKEIFEQMKEEYAQFLEKYTVKYPFQFFNFYKIFM